MIKNLMDYQEDAVREVLTVLDYCRDDFHRRGERFAFSLSAVTGAGKTVIASTVIEALIHGSTEFDVEPDPGAVVLWISKDPSLNEQTRQRIIESADRIPVGDLVVLDKDFAGEKLEKGTVYFINPAKLTSTALFVKKTNARQYTFWDILDNTIKDPRLTLYVILDEAHEGMKPVKKDEAEERQSIVMKIINGNGDHAPVPIVWGISATVERFNVAMANAQNRTSKPPIVIDPVRVQKSGLLKNTLVLDIPDEKGDFRTAMLRDATKEFVAVSERWKEYGEAQKLENPVIPLLVVQIPNKESGTAGLTAEDKLIVEVLDTIRKYFPDFTDDCVAHVLGDREDIEVGPYTVPKVKPQHIEAATHIRILLAKDAVSTGWDCPRAEVLVSLRPGEDRTYITQLLGRMVRTPLARSTSDDRLNSASCFLPHFNRPTAKAVAEEIMGIKTDGKQPPLPPGPKVLFKPVDLVWNDSVPDGVKTILAGLPSLPKPSATPKPIKRALMTAAALAQDELVKKPNEALLKRLYGVLDGAMVQHKDDVAAHAKAIMEADVRRFIAERGADHAQDTDLTRDADENTVKEAFGHTVRTLSSTVAKGYLKRLWEAAVAEDPLGADLTAIQARVAALSRVEQGSEPVVIRAVEDAADKQTREWLDAKHAEIALLDDERQSVYEDIRGQAREPELVPTQIRPALRVEGGDENGDDLKRIEKHVLCDENGGWPLDPKFNTWEESVLEQELARKTVVAWYRNPSDAGRYSIRVPYKKEGTWKSLQPDFIFFDQRNDGSLIPSIVDPHSRSYSGALERLEGLAKYAEEYGDRYARIASIDEGKDKNLRLLDLKDPEVRKAILAADDQGKTAADLFNGPHSKNY